MAVNQYVYLAANFPDDGLEDERGWIEYPGRIVAAVLSQVLRTLGCTLDSVHDEDFKGWEFNFTYEKVGMWARVGAIEDFMVVLVLPERFGRSARKRRIFGQLRDALDQALTADPRFDRIRWYSQAQMDAGEWDAPSGEVEDEAGV